MCMDKQNISASKMRHNRYILSVQDPNTPKASDDIQLGFLKKSSIWTLVLKILNKLIKGKGCYKKEKVCIIGENKHVMNQAGMTFRVSNTSR